MENATLLLTKAFPPAAYLGYIPWLQCHHWPLDRLGEAISPVPISRLKSAYAAADNNYLLLLTTEGDVYTLGASELGQLGPRVSGRHISKVVLGGLRTHKAVVIGSENSRGETETGTRPANIDQIVTLSQKVAGMSKAHLGCTTVVEIAGDNAHTLFLTSDDKVYGCGTTIDGVLGLADDDPAFAERAFWDCLPEPALITFPDDDDPVMHITCAAFSNLAVTKHGVLYAWGQNTCAQGGSSYSAKAVSCGGQHYFAEPSLGDNIRLVCRVLLDICLAAFWLTDNEDTGFPSQAAHIHIFGHMNSWNRQYNCTRYSHWHGTEFAPKDVMYAPDGVWSCKLLDSASSIKNCVMSKISAAGQ
ncbi:Regulator of chromosome condensation [Grifola frondosa]|uniref:Regulator of chromosome condensation n=1 Tax=Grifola frondosa TaxID=5627 RepID=A0A1C7M7H3_GRIFR|nr:Regulator of chromosome condensation [Grifola frondosa]